MAETFNEDDELRQFKQWWRDNGLALVLGAGVGLAVILGWQWWQAHTESQSMQASGIYDEFRASLTQGDANEKTQALMQRLRDDFSGTPYATQASLVLARYNVEREDYNAAIEQLEWVVSNSDQEAMREIARVREARLLWAQDKSDQALALLDQVHSPAFNPLYAELKGDIHAQDGDQEAAREAYSSALQTLPAGSDKVGLERKLQNVGGTAESKDEVTLNGES